MDELKYIANLSVQNGGVMKGGKTAVVAPKDIDFGLARVYEAHTIGSEGVTNNLPSVFIISMVLTQNRLLGILETVVGEKF